MENKAFTLIELLVVVLIIGILAAIAVPQYRKAVAKSQFSTLKFMVKDIVQAQEAYFLANNQYADNFDDLDISLSQDIKNEGGKIFCAINTYHAYCDNNAVGMSLDHYYSQVSRNPKRRVCTVQGTTDLNDYRNSICQEETGSTEKTQDSNYNMIFWYY